MYSCKNVIMGRYIEASHIILYTDIQKNENIFVLLPMYLLLESRKKTSICIDKEDVFTQTELIDILKKFNIGVNIDYTDRFDKDNSLIIYITDKSNIDIEKIPKNNTLVIQNHDINETREYLYIANQQGQSIYEFLSDIFIFNDNSNNLFSLQLSSNISTLLLTGILLSTNYLKDTYNSRTYLTISRLISEGTGNMKDAQAFYEKYRK